MTPRPLGHELARLTLLCFAALLLVYLPQLMDPFVRHDDLPTLVGSIDMAYEKALDEGRWLNYWWQYRPILLPAPVHFLIYLAGWSVFSASTAVILLGREVGGWYKGYFALFVALSIPAFFISFWFNTLIPGMFVITLFAVATVFLPHWVARALLMVAVPLSFMAYTTFPFLLLTLVLLSWKAPKTFKSLVVTLGFFFVSLVLAVLVVYSLNYIHHGIFGIPVAQWRNPNEVETVADLWANLETQKIYLQTALTQLGGGVANNGVGLLVVFAAAYVALFVRQKYLAFVILVAAGAGLAPLFAKALMSGVNVPVRSLGWIWILIGLTLTSVAIQLSESSTRWGNIARITLMCVLLVKVLMFGKTTYRFFPPWQQSTREMAEAIPEGTETIYVYGSYWGLEGARRAHVQASRGLRLRLNYLTGAEVLICDETPAECKTAAPSFDPGDWAHVPVIEAAGQSAFVLLPNPDIGP